METTLQSVDKELALQQQTSEGHLKKTRESIQLVEEMHLQAEEHQRHMETTQGTLTSKSDELERENQLHRRYVCVYMCCGYVHVLWICTCVVGMCCGCMCCVWVCICCVYCGCVYVCGCTCVCGLDFCKCGCMYVWVGVHVCGFACVCAL